MPPTKPFAERLKAARTLRGMTQDQAAASIGTGRVTWVRWEGGKHHPQGVVKRAVEAWIEASKAPKGGRHGS